jgi:hypothetical protein
MEPALSEKALFLTREALPADILRLVRRRQKSVVMVHFAIAFDAPDCGLMRKFWVG